MQLTCMGQNGEQLPEQNSNESLRVLKQSVTVVTNISKTETSSDTLNNEGTTNIEQPEKINLRNMSLEEAAKLEVMRLSSGDRTPVSLIQELLSKRGSAPKYELVQTECVVSEPIFKYRISLASETKVYVTLGSGKSKKEAKHNAAKSVLDQLIGKDEQVISHKENLFKTEPNPVSLLQDASMARKWPPPIYETEEITGLPHERVFRVCVYVNVYKEEGVGKSKKIAKKKAAENMLKLFETVPVEVVNKKNDYEKGEGNHLKQTHESSFLTPQVLKNIQQFHISLAQKTKGRLLGIFLANSIEQEIEDPLEFLEELGDEMNFSVSFVPIEEKSKSNTCQSLLQLTTTPVLVFCGSGLSLEDAKLEAVHRAFDFLKLMNK